MRFFAAAVTLLTLAGPALSAAIPISSTPLAQDSPLLKSRSDPVGSDPISDLLGSVSDPVDNLLGGLLGGRGGDPLSGLIGGLPGESVPIPPTKRDSLLSGEKQAKGQA